MPNRSSVRCITSIIWQRDILHGVLAPYRSGLIPDSSPRMCRSLRGDGDEKSESEPEHAALSLRRPNPSVKSKPARPIRSAISVYSPTSRGLPISAG